MGMFLMFFTSCMNEELLPHEPVWDQGRIVFNVNTGKNVVCTRTSKDDERAIRSLGVFIVKPDGNLAEGVTRFYESQALIDSKLAVSIPVDIMETAGVKAYLVANGPDKTQCDQVKTEKELLDLAAVTKPADIGSKGIPMACGAISLNFTGGIATVDANMKRVMSTLCAKVVKSKGVTVGPNDFTFKVHGVSCKEGYYFKDVCKDTGVDQVWSSTSELLDEEVSLGYIYQSRAFQVEVVSKSADQSRTVEIPLEKAQMRNKKYVLKIHPKSIPEGKSEFTVTVEAWDATESDIDFRTLLRDFEPGADFKAKGIGWNEQIHVLDITHAASGSVLKCEAKTSAVIKMSVVALYDTKASSIGGEQALANLLQVGSPRDGITGLTINVPVQTIKVPLDIEVTIEGEGGRSGEITIKSCPDYAGTGIQPVLMANGDGKGRYWAPVNVGAMKIPVSVSLDSACIDITESSGKLFQWGRKFGFRDTNDKEVTKAERFIGSVEPLGYPAGKEGIRDINKWDGKCIVASVTGPACKGDWLLINGVGKDNPARYEISGWYQKLWNSGTENKPVKTCYDPCPAGWRIPSVSEMKRLFRENPACKEASRQGIYVCRSPLSGDEMRMPLGGHRVNGMSAGIGASGEYYTSSSRVGRSQFVWSIECGILQRGCYVGFRPAYRSECNMIRCIQE
ncbi:hypothetical protein BFGS084_01023 [Bacteroides fragilis]|nr:hypothetical protein BFGS084_01023 [Bacteroides fragilis]